MFIPVCLWGAIGHIWGQANCDNAPPEFRQNPGGGSDTILSNPPVFENSVVHKPSAPTVCLFLCPNCVFIPVCLWGATLVPKWCPEHPRWQLIGGHLIPAQCTCPKCLGMWGTTLHARIKTCPPRNLSKAKLSRGLHCIYPRSACKCFVPSYRMCKVLACTRRCSARATLIAKGALFTAVPIS